MTRINPESIELDHFLYFNSNLFLCFSLTLCMSLYFTSRNNYTVIICFLGSRARLKRMRLHMSKKKNKVITREISAMTVRKWSFYKNQNQKYNTVHWQTRWIFEGHSIWSTHTYIIFDFLIAMTKQILIGIFHSFFSSPFMKWKIYKPFTTSAIIKYIYNGLCAQIVIMQCFNIQNRTNFKNIDQ